MTEVDLQPLPYVRDRCRLEQVVNMLANAHQHTLPVHNITIVEQRTDGAIRFAVCDNGPGIADEELEAIFPRCYRGAESIDGSGLGLVIAKHGVELSGGRTWAARQPAQGVAFHVVLPQGTEGDKL